MRSLFRAARSRRRRRSRAGGAAARLALSAALVASAMGVLSGTAIAATTTGSKTFSNATPTAIPDDTPLVEPQYGILVSPISVSGLTGTVQKVTVSLYATSNRVSQLAAELAAPGYDGNNNDVSGLFAYLPATGDNLGSGCDAGSRMAFDDAAAGPASAGSSPYVGTFQPDPSMLAPLSHFQGLAPNGTWVLAVLDNAGDGAGALQCWSVTITTSDGTTTTFDNNTVQPLVPTVQGSGGPGVATSPVSVSGLKGVVTDVSVTVWVAHQRDADLDLTLVDPRGDRVRLARAAGGSGANFGTSCTAGKGATTFTDGATAWVMQGTAPFAGSYIPYEPLNQLTGLSTESLNGTWSLRATDSVQGNTGTIQCWSMTIKTSSGTTNGLTVVPRLGFTRPLPGTLPAAYMWVRNWTGSPIPNVTLTSNLPTEMSQFETSPDYYPGCSVGSSVLTCNYNSIAPGDQAVGGAFGILGNPKNGKVCVSGTATASGQTTSTQKACFYLQQYLSSDPGTGYAVGKVAHELTLPDQNDTPTSLTQFRGKWVLLQFGAVWCGPSNFGAKQDREEIDGLNQSGQMGAPIEFVQVLLDGATPGVASTLANAHAWATAFATDTPVLYTSGDVTEVARQQADTYAFYGGGLPATPTSVWIRPDGTIASIRVGFGLAGDTTQRFLNALP